MIKRLTYNYLWLPMVALVTLASCSTESDVSTASDVPMTFTCSAIPQSRADSETESVYGTFTGTNFGVMAKTYTNANASNVVADSQANMNNERVTKSGGSWSTTNTHYWPETDYVHFAAYAPYTDELAPGEGGMQVTLPAKPYDGYKFSGVVDGNTNWRFANEQFGTLDNFSANVNCAVPMEFNHALTQVRFEAILTDASETKSLEITELKLKNVRHQGSARFTHQDGDHNNWATADQIIWQPGDFDEDFVYEELAIGTNYYLMPQTLYAKGEDDYPQQVEVTYRINGTPGGPVTSTVPLKLDNIEAWTVNKSLVYTLRITSVRDVELDVSVADWEEVSYVNDFNYTVTVEQLITWDTNTCNIAEGSNRVVLFDDINVPAKFSFNLSSPKGGTWYAILIPKDVNSDNFTVTPDNGLVDEQGCTVEIRAKSANQSISTYEAELRFIVVKDTKTLPVASLTPFPDGKNYVIVQNSNK